MTDFVKKKREVEIKASKSENSEEIDLNNREVSANQVISDDNTICTRGTESSIITILRNSRREHFFDGRIKLYKEKLSLMEKEGKMRFSKGQNAQKKMSGCCKTNKYQVYRICITILGGCFMLLALFGILFLMLLPKIAEIQIRKSKMEIKEIDIFQISRQNGKTSFEVESVLALEKTPKYKTQFIHSLMQISYGIKGEEKGVLGDLYISQISAKKDGTFKARGRFTIKNKDSVNNLINYMTSNLNFNHKDEVLDEKITFYGKGLMSIRIFGILLNNLNVDKEMSYSSVYGFSGRSDDDSHNRKERNDQVSSEIPSFLHNNGFKMHKIWVSSHKMGGMRVNLEFELDFEKFLGNDSEKKSEKSLFFPKLHMENIGNLRFNVLYRNELITQITWYDANLKSGNNIWSVSLDFPEKLNNGHKDLIKEIIQNNDITKETVTIKGDSSGSEAFSDVFNDFEMKIPLSTFKSIVEYEFNKLKPGKTKVDLMDRLIQFINVSHIQILQNSEDLNILANLKVGYINPLGDSFPISLKSMVINSQLTDQSNYYGDITLDLNEIKEKDRISSFRSLKESNRDSSTIISMIENNSANSQLQRRVPRMQPKYESFTEKNEYQQEAQHVNKCQTKKLDEINEPLKFNACYNTQEFDMNLKINTDKVQQDIKNRWLESILFNYRKLKVVDSKIDAKITSFFGESDFNGINLKRNLLSSKNKIQLTGTDNASTDDDNYNFDDYYKEDEDDSEGTIEAFSVKNITSLIDANSVKILGEGFNNSWITKVIINYSDTLSKLGLDKLDIGPLGILISFDNSNIGFIGTNNFRVEKNSTLELLGVIKPENDPNTLEINHSLTHFIKSIITGEKSEIQGKSFGLEFKTNGDGKENCKKYFNYPKYLSEEEFRSWIKDGKFPPIGESDQINNKKRKGWMGKLLNGQKIEIPVTIFDDFTQLNIQKYIDKGMESNSNLIKESLCRVQSIFNNDIEFENSVDSDRIEIKKAINDKLKEKNIDLSNIVFQLFMGKRENDLELPIGGVFDLKVPNIISKELYMSVLSINYRLNIYERTSNRNIIEFEHMQNFQNLNMDNNNLSSNNKRKTENLDMKFNFENSNLKFYDESNQFTNTLYSLLNLPKLINEKISNMVIKSTIDIALISSIGILKLDNIVLTANLGIPECKRKMKILETNESESNISSFFKVESIQIQKIRLILPPRGIDIQLNTIINIPNYVENIKIDVIMGQCVFELKNQENHLLAIIKTPKQVIIGNNRITESVCYGFVPAKSWLPMMNLIGNEEKNEEKLHVKAINTPHGIPYWLVPVFEFLKLPASSTLSSLDSTEFGSVTFS
ncbi:uncharacterized protein cubi_02648 [Cryptosporidium ubiquitum]|uniref:Transmembrane protein n=1 Tax=Cryptosporidium ubiquitum TaxID=857276 RepID=A0A1J4MK89_9CRYT|nr:uncharacterized protein cubi_02648 [Cryptosporidium ubiquitum]OII73436.1 hypothetical protein cubi_02648 [Cryptosporidium ubiquitum]